LRAPAYSAASCTARCSTPVMPDGHADDHAGLGEPALVHLLDEVAQHLLADLEVGDHAVLQRPDGLDVRRRAADHALRLEPTASGRPSLALTATTDGSFSTMPSPRT
jgi:hypothetical protein